MDDGLPVRLLIPNRGVGVLLPGGAQAALFRLDDGTLRAVGNIDPFSGAAVMSRGIVGDRAGRATVQSPIKKQAFALDDGRCLDTPDDNPDHCLPVYATRITPTATSRSAPDPLCRNCIPAALFEWTSV